MILQVPRTILFSILLISIYSGVNDTPNVRRSDIRPGFNSVVQNNHVLQLCVYIVWLIHLLTYIDFMVVLGGNNRRHSCKRQQFRYHSRGIRKSEKTYKKPEVTLHCLIQWGIHCLDLSWSQCMTKWAIHYLDLSRSQCLIQCLTKWAIHCLNLSRSRCLIQCLTKWAIHCLDPSRSQCLIPKLVVNYLRLASFQFLLFHPRIEDSKGIHVYKQHIQDIIAFMQRYVCLFQSTGLEILAIPLCSTCYIKGCIPEIILPRDHQNSYKELELKMEFTVIQELLNYFNNTVCTKECMPLNSITVVQSLLIFEWRFAINRDQAHGIVEAAVTLLPLDHLEEKIAETFYIFVIRMFVNIFGNNLKILFSNSLIIMFPVMKKPGRCLQVQWRNNSTMKEVNWTRTKNPLSQFQHQDSAHYVPNVLWTYWNGK